MYQGPRFQKSFAILRTILSLDRTSIRFVSTLTYKKMLTNFLQLVFKIARLLHTKRCLR